MTELNKYSAYVDFLKAHGDECDLEATVKSICDILCIKDALMEVGELLKKHGITITSEGVEVPYSDEWDYIEGYDRKTLIKCDAETQLDCEDLKKILDK